MGGGGGGGVLSGTGKSMELDDGHVKMFKPYWGGGEGGINIKELQEGSIKVIYFSPFSGLLQKNVIELQLVSELFGLLLR